MKRRNILIGILITMFFSITSTSSYGQEYPLYITTFIKPPYPTKFEDWENILDKVIINVANLSSKDYDVNLNLEITGPNGFVVYKQKTLNNEFNLSSRQSLNFKGDNWNDLDVNLKFQDIQPQNEREFILKNRAFREGTYQICWQATDKTGTVKLSDKDEGCYSFEVVYGETPQIINPAENSSIPFQSPSIVSINWTHQVKGAPFEYTVKVIELSKYVSSDINQNMNNPGIPALFEEDGIKGFSKILINENFKKGHKYAVRVSAEDPRENVFFKNAGNSKIIVFIYGESNTDCINIQAFSTKPHFPINGDTLPFVSIPFVAEMTPHCDAYNDMLYTFSINEKPIKKARVIFKDGLLDYFKKQIKSKTTTWQVASKLNLFNKAFKRGQKYKWGAEISMKNIYKKTYISTIDSSSFVVGMPKPKLTSPAENENVSLGDITFSMKPIMSQRKLLPSYKLINYSLLELEKTEDNNGKKDKKDKKEKKVVKKIHPESIISKINEHWVIQVFSSDTPDNSTLIAFKDGKINLDPEDYYDTETRVYNTNALMTELRKEISADIKIDKKGDYWWRVVWLVNPDGSVSSLNKNSIYHPSSLRKFHVGPKDNDDTEDAGDCISNCIAKEITDKKETKNLKINQVLKIGLFDLKVATVLSSKNGNFSGTGEIVINFLNNLKMEVEFTNIKKNKDNQIFEGTVKAIKNTKNSSFFTKYNKYIKIAKKMLKLGLKKYQKHLKRHLQN